MFTFKNCLAPAFIGLVLSLTAMKTTSAQSFNTSDYDDLELAAANDAINTGTDLMVGDARPQGHLDPYCQLTATVWDGPNGSLAITWGTIRLVETWQNLIGQNLTDPDVVVEYFEQSGRAHVLAVGIGEDGYVHIVSGFPACHTDLGNATQVLKDMQDCKRGNPIPGFCTCYNPNIDCNSDGKVVIVWAESTQYSFSFAAPSPAFNHSTPNLTVNYGTSNIFALHCFIDGTTINPNNGLLQNICFRGNERNPNFYCKSKIKFPTSGAETGTYGNSFPVYNDGTNAFSITTNQEMDGVGSDKSSVNPDVGIGEGEHPYVSYAFIQDGQLVVYQHLWGKCPDPNNDQINNNFTGFNSSRPRIASRPNSQSNHNINKNFVVVGAPDACSMGDIVNNKVVAVWMHDTYLQLAAWALNTDADLTHVLNFDPVVQYSFLQSGNYAYNYNWDHQYDDPDYFYSFVVAWTVHNANTSDGLLPSYQAGIRNDVISKVYNFNGGTSFNNSDYRFVNYDFVGSQMTASLSSPNYQGYLGYAFVSREGYADPTVSKLKVNKGVNSLDANEDGLTCSHSGCHELIPDGSLSKLIIYPNPGSTEFKILVNGDNKSEKALITLTDMIGQIVLQQEWNKRDGTPQISVKELPSGLYHVNFVGEIGKVHSGIFNKK